MTTEGTFLSAAEREEMANPAFLDRLSDLPSGIIHDILGRVPIQDAVRTCILSKQWMYTWTTLPRLLCISADADDVLIKESTVHFITKVLLLHEGPIHRFKLCYWCNFAINSVDEWVLCLSRNDIKELVMRIDTDYDEYKYLLRSSIYSCAKLTELELKNFIMDPPPSTFKGFMSLTSLVLDEVELSSGSVENLVACCPVLERLTVNCCSSLELRIRCKSLKNLQLRGEYTRLFLYAPLLARLEVTLTSNEQFTPENQSSVCNYTNLFGGFTDLVELSGVFYFTQYLSMGIESCHQTLVLHRLKFIQLDCVNFGDTKEIAVVARLIIGAPNLHKLQMSTYRTRCRVEAQYMSFEDFGCTPSFRLEKLRDITLSNACSYVSGMQLINFLLEKSPVLETLDLGNIKREESAQLLGFRRSSPNARIVVNVLPD